MKISRVTISCDRYSVGIQYNADADIASRRDEKPSLAAGTPGGEPRCFSMASLPTPRREYFAAAFLFRIPVIRHPPDSRLPREILFSSRAVGTKRVASLSFVVAASTLSHPDSLSLSPTAFSRFQLVPFFNPMYPFAFVKSL